MKVRKRQPRVDDYADSATSGTVRPPSIAPHPDLELLVTRGDTLSGMAGELTGDWREWPVLHELNAQQVPDPDVIDPGDVLDLPAPWRETRAAPKRPANGRRNPAALIQRPMITRTDCDDIAPLPTPY